MDAHVHYTVTTANILIPPESFSPLVNKLSVQRESGADEQALQQVIHTFLAQRSWVVHLLPDGRLHVQGREHPLITLVGDSVLSCLVGCAVAGSFVQGYGPQNLQWQLRYYASHSQLVFGEVTFPYERGWDTLVRSLLLLREATNDDLPALQSLTAQPVDLDAGTVLVAEVGRKLVAFVQYHSQPGDPAVQVITRVAMQPNGRRNGYPQALIAGLQRRFPHLLAVSVNPDHAPLWRAMGFALQQPEEGGTLTRTNRSYRWEASHQSREQLIARYRGLLEQEEPDVPSAVVRGVVLALERGDGPDALQYDRDSNQQHVDPTYFASIRWVWDDAIRVARVPSFQINEQDDDSRTQNED